MSYLATVINGMIASPGDVQIERNIAREVMHEWNSVNADVRKMIIHPIGWETDSAPSMGGPAQDIINGQILNESDLLIAIFWTRIGTPTARAVSGTVEEIEEHVAAGKLAMLYFSSAPVHPDSVDKEQYERLKEFKYICKTKGLYETYESNGEFREKFSRQLSMHLNKHPYFTSIVTNYDLGSGNTSAIPDVPAMAGESKTLLKEASQDSHGLIYKLAFIGGYQIQTNGKQFVEPGNARSRAAWDAAIMELVNCGYIEERGYKGETFAVTMLGYKVADLIG